MDQQGFCFAEDFGQKVDLTQRIREVLSNYPEGTTILKELIQNADDAGATRVSFCLDRRLHGTETLAYGPLAEWQGPALLASNNAQFGEEDFESISRIGDSKKRGQAWKTGRFGVGFNSVYHLSDLPSFVSGRYVVMFDPHCKFLPQVSSANPGKRINFVSTGALNMYRDQFTPYCAFGCDMESPYSGTLFRFPLRSEQQAAVSRLSRQSYSEEDMSNLLYDLYLEGVQAMLFLKSVEVLEIYEWQAGMIGPQKVYGCSINSPSAEIRWHRQAFARLSRQLPPASQDVDNHNDVYLVEFVSEVLMGAHRGEARSDSFLIAQSMGAAGSRIGALAKNAKDYDLHLLPWAAIAAKVASTGQKAQEGVGLAGQAFCFLPLPVKTGLPVHVNGYFELSSNRRDIWYGADMDRGGKLRSDWNRCLLEDVVAPAFSLLLLEASKQLGPIALYNSLWPCGTYVDPWLNMVKRLYSIGAELPLLHTAAGGGRWITPKQSLYHDEEFIDAEGLAGALIAEGFPLVRLSTTLRNTLFRFCVPNPRLVLPGLIRSQLRKPGKHIGLVNRSNALVMLEYCLGDVIDHEAGEVLSGLPLVPLANGSLGIFGKKADVGVYIICTELEYRLLEALPEKIIDRSINEKLLERLNNIAGYSNSNLFRLVDKLLVQLLDRLLPPEWKGIQEVEWRPESNTRHPKQEWLTLVWQYLRENCKELSLFKEWPLLPTTCGHLCRLQIHSKILRAGAGSPSLERILIKLGCQILRDDMGVEHPFLSSYVHDASAAGVVDTIFAVALHQPQYLSRVFETLNIVERRQFREYLYDAKWYAGDQMSESRLTVVKAFPFFEVYTGLNVGDTINVDLIRSKLFLPPVGVEESLLGPEFLHTNTERELEWLAGPIKVTRLERPTFYKWRVLNRLEDLTPQLRDRMMLCVLRELPQLAAVDSSIREALKQLPFVPTASGMLRVPKALYDPRSMELTTLLEDQDLFPAGDFVSEEVLDMLQGLGLKVAVVPETILQSAKQVEALMAVDSNRAHAKGRALLSYLQLNAGRWLPQQPSDDSNKTLGRMIQKVTTIFQGPESILEVAIARFWYDLTNLSWCPVLMNPPHPQLPWPSVDSSVAPPKHVALQDEMWLVSASMRILDGECRSSALASKLGWLSRPTGNRLAAQLLELGKNHIVVEDRILGQALATVVPRIYTLLNEMLGSDEVEIVKVVLEGSRWVWVGDGFANVQEVAFSGPLHLAPYLRVIPADLAAFRELLHELGVRETLTPNEFTLVLSKMAADKQGAPLDSRQLSAAVWVVQHLADLHFNSHEVITFLPDANSILVSASELVYNDAPWLPNSGSSMGSPLADPTRTTTGPRFVHAKISTDVAERMGVRSLRRMLLAESADSMDLGLHEAAEAFGQHEALTTRLKHIVEMYADGPGILCELVQNADDAGAKEVSFLLDRSQFGTSSVLSPKMADWQGPALYCCNDSVFTARDLYAISRIGQDSKLEKPSAIGRFGLGFNSVYHFTDIPGFISGSNLVMFDPHACNLPGITPSHPGLKISFVGRGLLEQFPDQLRPYLLFGCDLQRPYPGTLFRFPLRTEKTAASSEIKQEAYRPEDVLALFWSFKSSAEESLLFLRNVANISVYVREDPNEDMQLLYQVKRSVTPTQSSVYQFIRGDPHNPIDKEQFYRKLIRTPEIQLPWQCQKVEISLTTEGIQKSQGWLISNAMGGRRARGQAIAPENRARGFVPWAGIAAPLWAKQPVVEGRIRTGEGDEDGEIVAKNDKPVSNEGLEGRAFCFLPLPVKIGLPVHINGYFELSSNRRDIWYGDDMAGGGKLRSNWNHCLLEDVAAPAYARLLSEAARELGPTANFHSLWPTGLVSEPWWSMVQQVYKSLVDLDLPVLYTTAARGKWVSPKRAVFPDNSFAEAQGLGESLAEVGLPIISAPNAVVSKFQELCPWLRHLTPSMLRKALSGTRRILGSQAANVLALKYCLTDVEEEDAGEKLQGLTLVPLCNESYATIAKAGAGERILVTMEDDYDLLQDAVPYMLVDRGTADNVIDRLRKIAKHGGTNLSLLTGQVLEELLPRVIPAEWRGKATVAWTPGEENHPSVAWMELLWKFLDSSCEDLTIFSEWPLLPTSDGQLLRLVRNSCVLRDDGWSENMLGVLQKAQCAILRSNMQINHPALGDYVHDASAVGVLDSLRAASSGHLQSLAPQLLHASDGERRELRSFLCQSKWFASGKMDARRIEVFQVLPVFESYSSGGHTFVDLPEGKRWFAPDGIDEGLLGGSFVRPESQKEEEVLTLFLGVKKLSKAVFYRDHIFSNISQIPVAVSTHAMVAAILDFEKLVQEDPAIEEIMAQLPFVLTASGSLEAPRRLYDPRVPELQTLLNKQVFFPSGDFSADVVLDGLGRLGLRRSLGRKGLLDSARSVAMIGTSDKLEAVRKAKALLVHLDDLQVARESSMGSASEPLLDSVGRQEGSDQHLESSLAYPGAYSDRFFQVAHDDFAETHYTPAGRTSPENEVQDKETESQFWLQLTNISWCPVLTSAPDSKLPWRQILSPIAPPKLVRPKSYMWIVSATMCILDGECRSRTLATKLGWEEHPNVGLLAAQLVELSKRYAEWKKEMSNESESLKEINVILSKEIPAIYKLCQERVGLQDMAILKDMLAGVQWVWVGEDFVSPRELAFDSPAHFHPYLHIVPTEIVEFRKLLTTLGVRETFEASDYARVLLRIAQDMKGRVLAPEQLTFCLRVLEALAEVLPPQGGSKAISGSVLVPDASGVLVAAKELVFNDAPWLAKSASGMEGMRRLVHPDIDNELAERLGAKSLRYLSLVDQEMTSNLSCLGTSTISEVLSGVKNEELLLFDLLEVADCCKARKVHILYDKREHPRQSLLQPNLGPFQGPALTVAFEGAVLTTNEVCVLLANPPAKLRGQLCQYGSGLLGAYHVTELPIIVSGGFLYLFDPSGQVLAASLADGRGASSVGTPVGKAYAVKGTDLAQRFSDQFRPLEVNSTLSWARPDATIFRMPLRSAEQAAERKFEDGVACTDADIARILNKFKIRASSALLFLKSVEDVSVAVWEEGEALPHELVGVRVNPARALLRNPFQEKKWRNFKFHLSNIFGSSSSASKVHTIDVLLTEDGTQVVDKWLVVQSLGSGHTRDMALDRKYLSYNFTPIAGVAAHMSRNGAFPAVSTDGCILTPLPLPTVTGLPVTIMGHFMVTHGSTRHLFNTLSIPELTLSTDKYHQGSRVSVENVAALWNRELLACVRDSYVELLQELHRLRQDPSTSRADPPIGRGLDGTYGGPAERAYSFWPRSRALVSKGADQLDAVDVYCLVECLIKPMYMRLVDLPMWQLHGGAMAKASDGMFLSPPGVERQGMAPPATVCDFLKAHYRVFAVPWELTKEMEAAGVSAKELTPKMLRTLLRIPSVAAAVPSVVTQVDLLEFCCTDLHVNISSSFTSVLAGSSETSERELNGTGSRSLMPLSPEPISHANGLQRAVGSSRGQAPSNVRMEQQTQIGSRPLARGLDGRDPLDWFADFGRAIADLGVGVINDISRDAVDSQNPARAAERDLALDRASVLELKGLLCPTAINEMVKLGVSELWVGNREQQDLLPRLALRFVHSLCVERSVLADLFHHHVFRDLLKLQPFSSKLLAANLGAALPQHWNPRGAVAAAAPWVNWNDSNGPMPGPSAEWLRMFWRNVDVTSPEDLALFSKWPLIPAVTSTPVLVRVVQRQLIFVPPVPQKWLPIAGGEDATANSDEADSMRGFLELERQHPWLLPLLRNCNIPVYDRRFLDCKVVDVCMAAMEKSLPQILASNFLALQKAGWLSASELTLMPADCDALFLLFASCTYTAYQPGGLSSGAAASAFSSEEHDLLRSLPIYKTCRGGYVTLDQQVHCIVPPSEFLQPDDDLCLEYRDISEGGSLYRALGIPELADHEVMARFALPGFDSQSEREQERILAYLTKNWSSHRQHENVLSALRETKFVRTDNSSSLSNATGDVVLFCPPDLMDPGSTLLKRVFSDEPCKFPGGQFATAGWLSILRDAGLRSAIDPPLLLECAKKVEELGKESFQTSELGDSFESESAGSSGVSIDVWTTAGMLVEALLSNLASVYGANFCEALGRLKFVPAERGIPSVGGAATGRKVLASYSEAILLKDWPLAWTCAPVLARSSMIPPEFSWGAFRLRHPPAFSIVVKHLQMVGKNGGEDILARWPNARGMRTVEDAFGDVLKYLSNIWDRLSTSETDALKALKFIPVANGTRLATATSLFARLGMDLAPFVFELPSAYLAHVDVLSTLGMKDLPTFESMRALLLYLQRSCGYQRLNPNELRAVLRILQFICDKENRAKSMVGHMLPDPAEDAVVPDDSGRLLQARACVYADSAGASLVGEIDSTRVRFVHPHVPEELCSELGVRKLSEVVVEELDETRSLVMLDDIGPFLRTSVAEKLRSPQFADAMWAVVQEAGEAIVALKQGTSKQQLVKTLSFAADGLWFVQRLYTRFLMLPGRTDVTRRIKRSSASIFSGDEGDTSHRVYEYVDKANDRLLIAEPSQGVSLPDLLAVVVSRLIGSPVSLPIGPLFTAPEGTDMSVLHVLRLGLNVSNRGGKNDMQNSGVLGMDLVGADAALVQCHPLRPFHAGEIVAWRPDGQGGMRYGRVLHDVRASAGQAMYRLEVETGPSDIRLLLSSQVLSFKGTAAASSSAAALESQEDWQAAVSSLTGEVQLDRLSKDSADPNAEPSGASEKQKQRLRQTASNVPAAEVVGAVRDMLAAAGLPMGADQTSLLEHSLALQEQLSAADTALVEEQERAETAVREAEAARTAWTCRVCLTNEVDTIVVPCGHVLCQRCSSAVTRCPFCRRQVTKSQRIYRP